MLALDYTRSTV